MILRDLKLTEIKDFNRIVYSDKLDTFQILLGIMSIDLIDESSDIKQISYFDLCNKISGDYYPKYGPAALFGIIDTWIRLSMSYKGFGNIKELNILLVNGLNSSIRAAVFGLADAVCHVGSGMTGKKQRDIWNFYIQVNEKMKEDRGLELYQLPEATMKYILTCLDYLGFKRQERSLKPYKVDVSNIKYQDII